MCLFVQLIARVCVEIRMGVGGVLRRAFVWAGSQLGGCVWCVFNGLGKLLGVSGLCVCVCAYK